MSWLKKWVRHPRHPSLGLRTRLNLERLETRIVPYVTAGASWPNPQLVTISFEPDGTDLGGVSSNLFATFNAHSGWTTATWQNQILKAAQQWAQQTNINFAVIPDDGVGIGGGLYQQGDPGMGDIRIGGYNFGTSDLAGADYPPPINNFSIAGDIAFNTGQGFNIGTTYDLFSVAMHEFGHALGLAHSTTYGAVMQAAYKLKTGLFSDDISGIRNIYSNNNPRSYDAYYGAGTPNNSFANAANVSSLINPATLAAVVNPLDITTTSVNEYFTFTVPSGSQSPFTVTVQSSGLSMLAPKLTVYNSSQTQIGSVSGAGQYGTTITYTVTGASAGQQYYAKVAGADSSAFGTGAYGLVLNFGILPAPTVPSPNTQVLDGVPPHAGGGTPQVPGDTTNSNPTDSPSTPVAATQNQPAVASPSPAPATSIPYMLATSAGGQQAVVSYATTPVLGQTNFIATAQAATVPPQTTSVSLVESGSGQSNVQAVDDDLTEPSLPAFNPDSVRPEQGTPAQPENLFNAVENATSWREASTACFATDASAKAVSDRSGQESAALVRDGGPSMEQAAGAACLLLMLGSYWHAVPEDSKNVKRKPARSLRT